MTASILAVEIRDELYAIIREPTAAFFSIAMPVGMFAVFATLFGTEGNGPVSGATLMLATFGAFGVISVALTPGIGIAEDRERGWLQVKRVSPVPVRTTLAAKVAASLPVAFGVYAAMSLTAFAMGLFDTDMGTWLQIAGLLLLGSLPFALLSMAVGFVARGRAAPAIINAVFLPMADCGCRWRCSRRSCRTWPCGCRPTTRPSSDSGCWSASRSSTTSPHCWPPPPLRHRWQPSGTV
jgi:ABC-2 type transport system permease protein